MKKQILRVTMCLCITFLLMLGQTPALCIEPIQEDTFDLPVKSAVLMDYNTGTVIYKKNETEALSPASVTKIMTLLLVMEEIEKGNLGYDDNVSVSEYAASMGGSQVFLEAGESIKVEDLIKSIIVASGNDAAVAMAETVAGSESEFIKRMNEKAAELGMTSTKFYNSTGLDDTEYNLTSALDIALMSRALMRHEKIFDYSTIWMDSIRDGAFGLTNTNRLIRFYSGATGLKTGSTSKAGFCISATAKRDDLHLIAVIMGAENRDVRNECAKKLLDFGFANYSVYKNDGGIVHDINVKCGIDSKINGIYNGCEILCKKCVENNITVNIDCPSELNAPIAKNDVIGKAIFTVDGNFIYTSPIVAEVNIRKISYFEVLFRMFKRSLLK